MMRHSLIPIIFAACFLKTYGMDTTGDSNRIFQESGEKSLNQKINVSQDWFEKISTSVISYFSPNDLSVPLICLQFQPTYDLPPDIVLKICDLISEDSRDIWSFLRTNKSTFYSIKGKFTKHVMSKVKILDLERCSDHAHNLFLKEYLPSFLNVTSLNLRGWEIGNKWKYLPDFSKYTEHKNNAATAFNSIIQLKTLTSLNLSNNSLDEDFLNTDYLMKNLLDKLPLEHLDLSYNDIGNSFQLFYTVNTLKITFLDLSYNTYSSKTMEEIVSLCRGGALMDLRLRGIVGTGIFHLSFYHISNINRFFDMENRIKYLDISDNRITNEDFSSICGDLKHNFHLETLNLSNNSIDEEIITLAFILKKRDGKILLDLMNSFTEEEKFRSGGKIEPSALGNIKERLYLKISPLSKRLDESGDRDQAQKLQLAWNEKFGSYALDKIYDILNPMNVTLTHLDLRGNPGIYNYKNALRDLNNIPGLTFLS